MEFPGPVEGSRVPSGGVSVLGGWEIDADGPDEGEPEEEGPDEGVSGGEEPDAEVPDEEEADDPEGKSAVGDPVVCVLRVVGSLSTAEDEDVGASGGAEGIIPSPPVEVDEGGGGGGGSLEDGGGGGGGGGSLEDGGGGGGLLVDDGGGGGLLVDDGGGGGSLVDDGGGGGSLDDGVLVADVGGSVDT